MLTNPAALAAISALMGATIPGILAIVQLRLTRHTREAEIQKTQAEAEKIQVESASLTSERLIQEIDRLALTNQQQVELAAKQRLEIDELRKQVFDLMMREAEYKAVIAAYRVKYGEP